ncbi:hypothetical protein VKT23_010774 [Stygiomarasmius scandens]|uniref:SH3 domain-containing protein n=1 Tax=Marasmiellus scandens TaxID=2682957 RepID=A0ABR1JA71_9AGAR
MAESTIKHPPPLVDSKHSKTPSTPTPMSAGFTPTTPTPHNFQSHAPAQVVIPPLPTSPSPNRLSQTYNLTQSLNSPPPSASFSKSRPTSLSAGVAYASSTSTPPTPSSPAFFAHNKNRDSTASNTSGISLSSNRPAPPSPAMSRRTSGIGGVEGAIPLSRANSKHRASAGLGMSMSTTAEEDPDLVPTQPNTPALSSLSSQSQSQPNSSVSSQITIRLAPLKIRDFAYPNTDARFFGLGFLGSVEHVPKQNRLRVLNKALLGEEAYRLWRAERKQVRENLKAGRDRRSTSSLAWSSASEASEEEDIQEAGFDDEDEDEDDGNNGWGSSFKFGMGRLSWSNSNSTSAGYPSQKELARNFAGMEDSPATSSSEDDDAYYDAEEEAAQDQYQDSYEGEEDPPLLPGYYRALYPFEPEPGSHEIALEEEQIVKVVGRGGGVGWAVVVVGKMGDDGVWRNEGEGQVEKHGLVPESYLEVWRLE